MLERRHHEGQGGHAGPPENAAQVSDQPRGFQWRLETVLPKYCTAFFSMEPSESIVERSIFRLYPTLYPAIFNIIPWVNGSTDESSRQHAGEEHIDKSNTSS